MKIQSIKISNFRSIVKLDIKIDKSNNFICFCGANNVGKTNILNALNLFFGKSEYKQEKDCPNHKYYGTQGGFYQPRIEIEFSDSQDSFKIIRDWNANQDSYSGKKNGTSLTPREVEDFINRVNFFYLPSINVSFPDAIKYIMNSDIIDLETGKTRMSGKKGEMKLAIEKVLNDLKSILDTLGENISPLLEKYKDGWGVAFDLPTEINTFRDLMIGEIDFYIKDKSNSKAIDAKGSGLQRLCHILMYFRIIEKLNDKKQKVILCIDEPDVYLHSGLQKKLLGDILNQAKTNQIFITSHSSIFIDTVKLSNVFLLDQKIEEKTYQRAKRKSGDKKFNAIETHLVDFNEVNGISILKNYLGIEDTDNLIFDKCNLLVEGEEDKIYISKLLQHYDMVIPNIIACNGADNIPKYLDFYESIAEKDRQCIFLVILDNDQKGRELKRKIKIENYNNIVVGVKMVVSYSGYSPALDKNGNSNANIEIEDFINPKIICYLVNKILKQKKLVGFNKVSMDQILNNLDMPAFKNGGILSLLENKKNELNPESGQNIQVSGQGVKSAIAGMFNQLDNNIIQYIGDTKDVNNKYVVSYLREIGKLLQSTINQNVKK